MTEALLALCLLAELGLGRMLFKRLDRFLAKYPPEPPPARESVPFAVLDGAAEEAELLEALRRFRRAHPGARLCICASREDSRDAGC